MERLRHTTAAMNSCMPITTQNFLKLEALPHATVGSTPHVVASLDVSIQESPMEVIPDGVIDKSLL